MAVLVLGEAALATAIVSEAVVGPGALPKWHPLQDCTARLHCHSKIVWNLFRSILRRQPLNPCRDLPNLATY